MRIAIVGAGISGLVAARLLSRRHEITVFEAAPRAGGHTNTVEVEAGGRRAAVDTGFIVFNDRNYPGFTRLLEILGVARQPTSMSFSVRCDRTGLEYNGTSLNTLFAQRRNLLRPSFLRMIREILRFGREARELLADGRGDPALGEFLNERRYAREFRDHYIVPMAAALWSADPGSILEFPARPFARFFDHHGMLDAGNRPRWFVVKGGSRSYLEPLTRPFAGRIRLGTPVVSVTRRADAVEIVPHGGRPETFDHAVLAVHSDQALALLTDPSEAEREILGAIPYQENEAILHTDPSVLPKRRLARASWNYRIPREPERRVRVTYDMNGLQGLPSPPDLLVTLNDDAEVASRSILHQARWHHPVYTRAAFAAQPRREEISGTRRTWYCGAWWGYGFHEDGVQSGLEVARRFGEALDA